MGVFKCSVCGEIVEQRCKPGKCPKCGAPKEEIEKQQ